MASNIFKDIGDGLADFVHWAKDALEDEAIRKSIAEDLGLDPGQSIQKPPNMQLSSVDSYKSKANPDKEAFVALLNDVRAFYLNVRTAVAGFGSSDSSRINSVVYLVFDMLAANYVRLYLPTTYALIQAMSAIVEDYSALEDRPDVMDRIFAPIARAIGFLLSPIGYTFTSLAQGVESEERAKKVSDRIFPQLAAFFLLGKKLAQALPSSVAGTVDRLGTTEVIYGWDSLETTPTSTNGTTPPRTTQADTISERMLSVGIPFSQHIRAGVAGSKDPPFRRR